MRELVTAWLEGHTLAERLSDLERAEVYRMANNESAAHAALSTNLSEETIRARRKHVLKKLNLDNARSLIHALLEFSCVRSSKASCKCSCSQPSSRATLVTIG